MSATRRLRPEHVSNACVVEPLEMGRAYVVVDVGSTIVGLGLYGEPDHLQPFTIERLDVMPHPTAGGVTGTLMRDIPVQECLRQAVEALIGPMPTLEPMTGHRPTREVLEAVLETYRTAEMHMVSPCPEVQKRFGLSHATATRWIARAREEHTHER